MNRALAMAAAILFSSPALADWSIPAMNNQIDQTNFIVNQGCSGTLIDVANRYILTAKHCTTGQYEIVDEQKIDADGKVTTEKVRRLMPGTVSQIIFDSTEPTRQAVYRTRVIAIDAGRDLALLQIIGDIPNTMAATLACVAPVRGDTVYVVGNPAGFLYSSVTKGIVSSLQRTYETIRFGESAGYTQPLMQVSAGIVGGNSGGAVYNDRGALVGVPVLAHQTNEILGFAVPLPAIWDFLKGKVADCPVT